MWGATWVYIFLGRFTAAMAPGNCLVSVLADGQLITKSEFSVRSISNPIALVGDKPSGYVDKEYLLKQQGLNISMMDFDFDMNFKITSFSLQLLLQKDFGKPQKQNLTVLLKRNKKL